YLGYVGLAVPYAFAMGALLSRQTDERWIVVTRRWTLAAWTFLGVGQVLGALAFCLSIFGTFLTRSGVINSIHSFSQSPLGGWFLGFIVVVTVFSVALIWLRLPLLRARTRLE